MPRPSDRAATPPRPAERQDRASGGSPPLRVTRVHRKDGSTSDKVSGLLAYITCELNGRLRLDGLTLRRLADGRYGVSFPTKLDRRGRKHAVVAPLDDATRVDLERQILVALDIGRESGR